MKRLSAICLIFLSLLSAAPAQQKTELPVETIKKIEAVIESEKARLKIPGLSVAIAVDNQLRYAKGFGLADIENSIPAKAETVYRTASIAKPMTATAVMQLVEQGKIDLDSPIQKYCRAFPEKQWPVTARLILSHQSGIRHYKLPGESRGARHYKGVEDSLSLFKDDALLFEPGAKFSYTTYGYSVLGCAIEGASGLSYDVYMRDHLFKPAGMERTRIDDQRAIIADRSRGYESLMGQIVNAWLHDTSMKIPGGGLVSTPADLVRFAIAVQSGKIVKRETLQQMWTANKTKDGQETVYGFGWGVRKIGSLKLYAHGGNQSGASSLLYVLPEKGIVIAIMTNLQDIRLDEMMNGIGKILTGAQ
ncbi:MAG: serine hydrolase domain-containing protein [Acidobacteriota bacterium]